MNRQDIGVRKDSDNIEPTQQAIEEIARQAKEQNADLDVFVFEPEEEMILKKATVYILVFISALVGYLMGSIV